MDDLEKAVNIRITQCYLIEVINKGGKELESDFCFLTYGEAKKQGKRMLENYNRRIENELHTIR